MIRRNTSVNVYFLPSITVALQSVILIIFGIFGALVMGYIVVFIMGLFFMLLYIVKDKSIHGVFCSYLKNGFYFLIGICILVFIYLQGKELLHYDNFSHWGLVVKNILNTNRFPTSLDTVITFQAYPLGSSAFICYFVKAISLSSAAITESSYLIAQAYLIIVCLIPLFIYLDKIGFWGMLVSAIIANFFFTYCILLTDLLVDTLLPISSACTFFFCIFQCEKNCNIKSLAIASIYTTYITQIKNSGTFFAIVIAIYLICGKKNNYKKSRIIAAAVPFLFMAVWSVHCKLAFNNAEYSMHAFSLENFKNSILSKSFESCLDITSKMVQYSISFKDVWSLVVLIVIMGLATFFIEKNLLNQWKTLFVFSAIIYTAYQIGILAMYIFSMPLSQALGLASCEKYSKASIIFLLYLCFVFASLLLYKIGDYTRPRVKVLSISLCILIISFSFFTTSGFSCFLFTSNEKDTVRRQSLEYLLDEYSIPKNKRCLIVLNQSDNWYLYYLAGYLFEPSSVSYYIPEEGNISLDSDYVVLYDDNPSMDEWVMNNYPDQLGEKVIFIE